MTSSYKVELNSEVESAKKKCQVWLKDEQIEEVCLPQNVAETFNSRPTQSLFLSALKDLTVFTTRTD